MVLYINSEKEFDEKVLNSKIPVIVDFWAEWCGPCRALGPIFESLSADYTDKVLFAKVDVDALGEIAAKYSIVSIPTLILFKNGQIVGQEMGVMPKNVLKNFIDSNI